MVEALMGWDLPAPPPLAMGETTFYRSRDGRGTRSMQLTVDGSSIRIGGQDLGPVVREAFGPDFREYEWDWTLAAEDLPRAFAALGGLGGESFIDALARWAAANDGRDPGQFLKNSGLDLGFWSRIGD